MKTKLGAFMIVKKCELNINDFESIKIVCSKCNSSLTITRTKNKIDSCPNCGKEYNSTITSQLSMLLSLRDGLKDIEDELILVSECE